MEFNPTQRENMVFNNLEIITNGGIISLIKNFLFSQFTGFWFKLYHPPGEEYENVECPTDFYNLPDGDKCKLSTWIFDKKCVQKW
jgi:hypothetical protein